MQKLRAATVDKWQDRLYPSEPQYWQDVPSQEEAVFATIKSELDQLLAKRNQDLLEGSRTFLPQVMQEAIECNRLDSDPVIVHRCTGCVIFSDASGFTALTERLAQKANGAEILSKCLNKFFTPLIDIITAYRGDVIKFSGDALTILCEAKDDYEFFHHPCGSPACSHTPIELACIRGAACCLEIHKQLHNFHTGEGDVRLTLHIGVGAGTVTILQVGGQVGRWEYVIAGQPLEQISVAEPLANSGETVLSPQAWEFVEHTVLEGDPIKDRPEFHRLLAMDVRKHTYPAVRHAAQQSRISNVIPADQMDSAMLNARLSVSSRFIPRAVLKQFAAGTLDNVNEMRSVSIIFCQIGGIDVSTDAGASVAQELMTKMQLACYGQEGNLNKFLVDDKGLLFLFVFGLPPLVHIDDPVRACRACFDMVDALQKMGLNGRCGLTTGRVFCGVVGSDTRREYTVMGDTVNLSARLMAAAKVNTSLVDEATYRRCKKDVPFQRLEPIKVKGKEHKIPIWQPKLEGRHQNRSSRHRLSTDGVRRNVGTALAANMSSTSLPSSPGQGSLSLTSALPLEQPISLRPTMLRAFCEPGRIPFEVQLPWRAKSDIFGGSSPLPKLKEWSHRKRVMQILDESKWRGKLILLAGDSGCGKEELAEHALNEAIEKRQMMPLFGSMTMGVGEEWTAVADIVDSALTLLTTRGGSGEDVSSEEVSLSPEEEEILEFLRMPAGSKERRENELRMKQIGPSFAARLVAKILASQSLLVVLRVWRGTTLFPVSDAIFWELGRQIGFLLQQNHKHELSVIVLSRTLPQNPLPDIPHELIGMQALTDSEAMAYISVCLGFKEEMDVKIPVELQDFVHDVSLNNPLYIFETLSQLREDEKIEVGPTFCKVMGDLNKVNIADWVHTGMVGGVISQMESMDAEKQRVIKMATVFDGPFSALDLAAASRLQRPAGQDKLLSFYDSVKTFVACRMLVDTQFLQQWRVPLNEAPSDRQSAFIPRWTIHNMLIRKVVASTLLTSHKMLIKRAVLTMRRLNVDLPPRMKAKLEIRESLLGKKKVLKEKVQGFDENRGKKDTGGSYLPMSCIVLPKNTVLPMGKEPIDLHECNARMEIEREEAITSSHRMSLTSSPIDIPSNFATPAHKLTAWLLLSCAEGSLRKAQDCLSQGASPNAKDNVGVTAVHFACAGGDVELVRTLLLRRADVHVQCDKGRTPLEIAATHGHAAVVQCLVEEHGALDREGEDPQRNIKHWEELLPDICTESDVPVPLAPRLGQGDPNPQELAERHQEIKSLLQKRAEREKEREEANAANGDPMGRTMSEPMVAMGRTATNMSNTSYDDPSRSIDINMKPNNQSDRRGGMHHRDNTREKKLTFAEMLSAMSNGFKNGRTRLAQMLTGKNSSNANQSTRQRIGNFIRGKFFMILLMICLFIALFFPDLWIVINGPQLTLNIFLCITLAVFCFEFVCLTLTDPNYVCTFFFWMDFIGTFSIIFDISWFLGKDPDEVTEGDTSVIIFRVARAAKGGARAGRLSRLVKFLRYLPGMSVAADENNSPTAKGISFHLTNVLGTRVAALTILLIMTIPMFNLASYPEHDYSLRTWVTILGRLDVNATSDVVFTNELKEFTNFYKYTNYGPFQVCAGKRVGEEPLRCDKGPWPLGSQWSAPERKSWQLDVYYQYESSDNRFLRASFNFAGPMKTEAMMSMALIASSILIMVAAALILSSSVSNLALRPIERMLLTVRNIAKTIFTTVATIEEEDPENDDVDHIESEVLLLERVVAKLANMASISQKHAPLDAQAMAGMKDEDLGVLAMMRSTTVNEARYESIDDTQRHSLLAQAADAKSKLEQFNTSFEYLDSWHFDALKFTRAQLTAICGWILIHNPGSAGSVELNATSVANFLQILAANYFGNPYHNWMHAADVTQTTFRLVGLSQASTFISGADQFALLVSASAHDVGHPGVNNPFLVETNDALARLYNDRSPLENMHCAKLFEIVKTAKDANIFEKLERDQYKDVRKVCIEAILHTDMVHHFNMVKELQMLYHANSDTFEANVPCESPSQGEIDLFRELETKKLMINLFLHAADVSNPCKPWKICSAWALLVLEEFFAQGDQEKDKNIPVQMLNDRDKVNKPNSQIGFIEFLVAPLIAAEVKLFPHLCLLSEHLEANLREWQRSWIEEVRPSEEEQQKVLARINKVADSMVDARKRVFRDDQADETTRAPRKISKNHV